MLGDSVTYLEDSSCEIEGVRFWGAPWQPEFNNWAFNLRRGAEIAGKWALISTDCDVLITHGPPAGFGDRCGRTERAGCADLLRAIERTRPMLHMFGHIHQDGGVFHHQGITIANVTTWECERGATVLDIDVAERSVTPVDVPARDPLHPDQS
jgi:Icc-related predicted phosphoesterase